MKEPYIEDLASHNGRESCEDCREAILEALTAVRTGPAIELRNTHQDADPLCVVEGYMVPSVKREFGIDPAESKTCGMCGTFLRENRETPGTPDEVLSFGRDGKAKSRDPSMYVPGESDADVVPTKSLNKTEESAAEGVEGRSAAAGNLTMQTGAGAQEPGSLSPGIGRVRELARKDPKLRFVNLQHHITPRLLHEAYLDLKKYALPGVDEVTWDEYGEEGNYVEKIKNLHERVQSGLYRALPSKRIYIPKADGRQRPIGIAAIEDKIVQKAMVWVLEAIYEEDFHNFSYGFRPGRNQHKALDAVWMAITNRKVGWILDADIKGFFDNIDHQWMLKFLEHRISDQRVLTLIRKWLRAGVSEDGEWSKTKIGTPQGAVISPLLANIYLHYVLDEWLEWWRKSKGQGEVYIVRYADDFVIMCQKHDDATRCWFELSQRMKKFGLTLHPEKTRLIEFGRFAAQSREAKGKEKPETFNFLGFTHICAKFSKSGNFTVRRQTIAKRMREKVKEIGQLLRSKISEGLDAMGKWLRSVVNGYYNYHAVPDNYTSMSQFRDRVTEHWRRVLRRRSQKAKNNLTWDKMRQIADKWLPRFTARHPYPFRRLIV